MKTLLASVVFYSIAFCGLAQSPERGKTFFRYVLVTVHHEDGSTENLLDTLSYYPPSISSGFADTIAYELAAQDSVTAYFYVCDEMEMGGYDHSWPLQEHVVYGAPVFDSVSDGYYSMNDFYMRNWSFTDSALFGFTVELNGQPTHYVKLWPAPETPAVVEETVNVTPAVFPNPASAFAFIRLPDDRPSELLLTDAAGRIVRAWSAQGSETLGLAGYPSGPYFIRITTDGQQTVFRMQKL